MEEMNGGFLEKVRDLTTARIQQSRREISKEQLFEKIKSARQPIDIISRFREGTNPCIIAEIKRRSPSRGDIAMELDVEETALSYNRVGATAISVLTEPNYFGGSMADLRRVRSLLPNMPLLMKDFVCDSYQLMEARDFGADAVLLIHRFLGEGPLQDLYAQAMDFGLTPLVEVHDESELKSALNLRAQLIGINNRDLRSLQIDLSTTQRLAAHFADVSAIFIAESGIKTATQIQELSALGYAGFLVGTQLMSDKNPEHSLRELIGDRK